MDANDRKTRRGFLSMMGSAFGRVGIAAGTLGIFFSLKRGRAMPVEARGQWGIVRPPGALEEKEFLARCIRCTLCADSCEAQCIRLMGPEAGERHGTPSLAPEERGCTLCMRCCAVCPTGALAPLKEKEEVKMGLAEVDTRLCVSHNGTGACGACHTICPLRNRALTQGLRSKPEIHDDHCVGCGMCEEICIVRDRRAIRVRTDRVWPGVERKFSRQDRSG